MRKKLVFREGTIPGTILKKKTGRLLFNSLIARLRMYISLQWPTLRWTIAYNIQEIEEHLGTLIPYNQEKAFRTYWPLLPYMANPHIELAIHFGSFRYSLLDLLFEVFVLQPWVHCTPVQISWCGLFIHISRDDRCFKRKQLYGSALWDVTSDLFVAFPDQPLYITPFWFYSAQMTLTCNPKNPACK